MIFRLLFVFVAALSGIATVSPAASQEPTTSNLNAALDRVFTIQQEIKDLHPAFERVYPIAVVREGTFHIYEPDLGTRHYKLEEWKEGLARYLENAVAARLGRPANRGGLETPFTRVTFYAGGEALIRALAEKQPAILKDIEALYHRIAER